jgi:hypothetical protein
MRGRKEQERFHRVESTMMVKNFSVQMQKRAERFLSSQAETFAGANVKRKSVGLLRSK